MYSFRFRILENDFENDVCITLSDLENKSNIYQGKGNKVKLTKIIIYFAH